MEEAAQEAHDTHALSHSLSLSISLSPFTHLFIYGYLDWKLQALPSSALTLLSSDALWMTACVNVDTKLHKAVLSTLTVYPFKRKETKNSDTMN